MTDREESPDLAAIARETEIELDNAVLAAGRAVEPDSALAASLAELGYYEAELNGPHDAAIALDEPERP